MGINMGVTGLSEEETLEIRNELDKAREQEANTKFLVFTSPEELCASLLRKNQNKGDS